MSTTTEETKGLILCLLEEGKPAEARPLCQAWLARADTADAWRILGVIAGREGKLPEAERCFREAATRNPADTKALVNLAHALRAQSKLAEAVDAYRTVLSGEDNAALRFTLADILIDLGDLAAAEVELRHGLAAEPDDVPARYNLGWVCQQQDRLKEARDCYEQVLARDPRHALALNNLGLLYLIDENYDKARGLFERVITVQPDFAPSWRNLGQTLIALGHLDEAVAALERSMRLGSDAAEAWSNIGLIRARQGRNKEAVEHFEQALRLKSDAEAHILPSRSRFIEDFPDPALAACERILATDPESPEAHQYKGLALQGLNRLDEAGQSYSQAIALKPDYAEAHYNLGNLHQKRDRLSEAEACYRRALATRPDYTSARISLGSVIRDAGRIEEALEWLSKEHVPDAHISLNYSGTPREAITAAHREWGERWGYTRPDLGPPGNDPDPERRLRIGYVSPDLRNHSVAYFIEPVLQHHDKTCFEVFAYAQFKEAKPDQVSERLRGYCDHWIETKDLGDLDLARRIRADGIDILIDLAGHTADNRLLALAYRPAPVQVSYLGYVNTTGLPAMGYRLCDVFTDPPGLTEHLYTEKLERLPFHYCYAPPERTPAVGPLPARDNGFVTFLSVNNIAKINKEVLSLWAEVLHTVPNARLQLKAKGLRDEATRDNFHARFAAHGIPAERVVLEGAGPFTEYLDTLNRCDIALDPFPFNGGTTTYHCLWMGLPVVALEGDHYVARMGTAILSTLGLAELVAESEEDYVRIAAGLAGDLERLAGLRQRLRPMMQSSTLTDGDRYTRAFEESLRKMWLTWCATGRHGDRLPGEVHKL